MRLFASLSLLMLLLLPAGASGLQLRWTSGASNLAFSEAARCTLVVSADSSEGLPSEWRLLSVSDSVITYVPVDSVAACNSDSANAHGFDPPLDPADSAANIVTAHFCSAGEGRATTGEYVLNLPALSHGKFKAVMLDPSDSVTVLESNEVTYNGGVPGDYQPTVLRTSTVHQSTEFNLEAVGIGLDSARSLTLVAQDGSWQQPLRIVRRSHGGVSATASLAAHVPACVLEAQLGTGTASRATVLEDPPLPPLSPEENAGCVARFVEIPDTLHPYILQPGDFAFVPAWTSSGAFALHLFYIRIRQDKPPADRQKNFGHAVSTDLIHWDVVDTAAVRTRGGRFDSLDVWAPNIVLKGLTYYMFYTGVDGHGDQRIGLATSTDLVTWEQGDSILEVGGGDRIGHVFWADSLPGDWRNYGGLQQLRDPFVMPDPDRPGGWLMYFATIPRDFSPHGIVGVARSSGDLHSWGETFPLWNTVYPVPTDTFAVESPQAFPRDGTWWLLWAIPHASGHEWTWAECNRYSPVDMLNRWSVARPLKDLVPSMQSFNFYCWHATEHLKLNDNAEYIGGVCDADLSIRYTRMLAVADTTLLFQMDDCDSLVTIAVPPGRATGKLRLSIAGENPARSQIQLRVEVPGRMRTHVAVYDVSGRRVRTILDGELPAGESGVSWDGRSAAGGLVGSGVYFARLTTGVGRDVVRVVLMR
jgi:hypothetical protein